MPIYEYRRPDGTTFEIQQSFSDAALTTDPESGVSVERVLHAPAVHFKGKGFYNTDYGKRNRGRSSSDGDSGDGPGASESSSSSSSSESSSKPATDGKAGRDSSTGKDSSTAKDQKTVTAGS